MPQDDLVVAADQGDHPPPVDVALERAYEVRDVAAVEAVPGGDVDLAGDHLFGAEQAGRHAEELGRAAGLEPGGAHLQAPGVAHGEQDVEQVAAAVSLGQPQGVADLGGEAGSPQGVEQRSQLSRLHEDVEVLGVAPGAGEGVGHVGPAQGVRHAARLQERDPARKDPRLLVVDRQRPRDLAAVPGEAHRTRQSGRPRRWPRVCGHHHLLVRRARRAPAGDRGRLRESGAEGTFPLPTK